jgi:glycosyltransferase involved in cell wall biosynthesis
MHEKGLRMRPATVSVVMATRNDDPRCLAGAIESINSQSYGDWELILIDDSTSGETIGLLDAYAARLGKERCRVVHNSPGLGLPRSLNAGMALARGELIARMDADDICLPDRLGAQVEYMDLHPDVGILGGDIEVVTQDLRPLTTRRYLKDPKKLIRMSYIRNPLAHPTVMMRKSVIDEIGGYDPRCRKAEDHDLWLRAIKRGIGVANMDKVLIQYRAPEEYSEKHRSRDWNYSIYAKLRNFNLRHPLFSLLGICVSIGLRLAPSSLVGRLYRQDHESPVLYREKKVIG